MRRLILWAFFLLFLAVFSLAGEGFVSIYADFQPDLWGRALQRSGLISPTPEEARQVPTVEAPEGGFLTGVILNREQGEQLMALLRESGAWTDGMISLELLGGEEPPTLEWYHRGWDARYRFRLERAPAALLQGVADFYSNDPYNGGLVDRDYRDNFVIRIYAGEDVLSRDGRLSFGEALVGATLLGDDFQPFWGFRNGLGALSSSGLLKAAWDHGTGSSEIPPPMPPVPIENSQDKGSDWPDFLHRVRSLPGSFPENLYVYTRTVCRLETDGEDEYQSPEEFFAEKAGKARDFALFFYQVLEDHGYEVRLVMVNSADYEDKQYIVTFRDKGSPLWGSISQQFYTGQRFLQWSRIPALLHQRSVQFRELKALGILREREWPYPAASDWVDSFY